MHGPPLRVVLLTPPGRGAVATVRVEGPEASERVDLYFHAASQRPIADLPSDRLAYGRFRLGEDVYDEVIVRRPENDAVEIHCHGGPAVVARLIDVLTEKGGERISSDNWLETSSSSPIAAAAHAALGSATTLRAATILLDQYNGALDSALRRILEHLDREEVDLAADRIQQLLAVAPCGCHLTRPWRVVLAGRPNVGKSSLINALVGYQRAIVHETPGTTRDLVTARTALNGWPVEFCDTAGLRVAQDLIEEQGIGLVQHRLKSASLVVLVFDASQPIPEEDAKLCRDFPEALFVFNKIDLAEASFKGPPGGQLVSALDGRGIDDLIATITDRLVPHPPASRQAVPFLDAHRSALQTAAGALQQGDLRGAARCVASLLS